MTMCFRRRPLVARVAALAAALLACWGLLASGPVRAEETKLYATGPDHDSGFLRFVNATDAPVTVTAVGAGKITLANGADDLVVGQFQAVPTETDLAATADVAGQALPLQLRFKANEFATVVIARGDGAPSLTILRDTPQEFNAVKADLAFYNADPGCAAAGLLALPKEQAIFQNIAAGTLARRSVNPVAAQLAAACGGGRVGTVADLGTLDGGGRYSLILAPVPGGHRLIAVKDKRPKF